MKPHTHNLEVGDMVRLTDPQGGPSQGTVTQVTRHKIRVLFPIRKFVWLYPGAVVKVGHAELVNSGRIGL